MNPRRRLQPALGHQQPDRVPMMMSASRWVVERLKKHLGGIETDRQLMLALGLDVWDTRGLDYKSGVAGRYVGPRHLEFPEDCAGNLFEFSNYHEEIIENEFGTAWAMGPPSIGVDAYPTLPELEISGRDGILDKSGDRSACHLVQGRLAAGRPGGRKLAKEDGTAAGRALKVAAAVGLQLGVSAKNCYARKLT